MISQSGDDLQGNEVRIFPGFVIIFVLALTLRLVFWSLIVTHPERMLSPDSSAYNALALNILSGKGFLLDSNSPYYWYSLLRTPVYPLFLSTVYLLSGENYIWVGFVQSVLSSLISALTFLIGQRLFGRRAGFIAGLLSAFGLLSIIYSLMILSDILFTIMLVSCLWCTIEFWIQGTTRWLLMSAVLLGIAILCRPIAFYYTFFLLIMAIVGSKQKLLQGVKNVAVFIFVVVLIVGSWIVHNWIVFKVPVISGISSYNLVYYNAASLVADMRGVDRLTAVKELDDRLNERFNSMGINDGRKASWAQVLAAWRYVGRKVILQLPGRYIALHLRSDIKSLRSGSDEIFNLLDHHPREHGTLQVLRDKGLFSAIQHYRKELIWPENVSHISTALLWIAYAFSLLGVAALVHKKQFVLLRNNCLLSSSTRCTVNSAF
ncbi:MAG TPA: glycosyltransferase family 39 protein [Candidatus Brocadiaceae bacterium]